MSSPPLEREVAQVEDLNDPQAVIIDLLDAAMGNGAFDAVVVPMRVPAGDGYAHVLLKERELLAESTPIPPVISVQAGKAASALTRLGRSDHKVCLVMRPCEARATIELAKLGQVELSNLTILTMDCPGALSLKDFSKDPNGQMELFGQIIQGKEGPIRTICRVCSSTSAIIGDLHVGLFDRAEGRIPLFSNGRKGKEVLDKIGLPRSVDESSWRREGLRIAQKHGSERAMWRQEMRERIEGPENLLDVFSACINCHNCMRVCPVCYCRQCYFDSTRVKYPADDYLVQAERKETLRLPSDMLLFQMGRMTHIGLTCVSCGACEDACPASVPVAQIFSYVAERTQKIFDYVPGGSIDDSLPLAVYKEEELEGEGDD